MSGDKEIAKKIIDNQHMGIADIQRHAQLIHGTCLRNDPEIGIQGIGLDGRPAGIIFTDPRLTISYSEKTKRTIVTKG